MKRLLTTALAVMSLWLTAEGNTFIAYPQEGSVLVALEHPASANLLQALRKIALYLRNATD